MPHFPPCSLLINLWWTLKNAWMLVTFCTVIKPRHTMWHSIHSSHLLSSHWNTLTQRKLYFLCAYSSWPVNRQTVIFTLAGFSFTRFTLILFFDKCTGFLVPSDSNGEIQYCNLLALLLKFPSSQFLFHSCSQSFVFCFTLVRITEDLKPIFLFSL